MKKEIELVRYFEAADTEYTDDEVKTFVDCLMVGQVDAEWTLKCLTAIALNVGLSEEEYEVAEEVSEGEEEGNLETYETSDFIEFIDMSLVLLLLQKKKHKWIRLYRDALLSVENYEMLHKLKLEKTWNF